MRYIKLITPDSISSKDIFDVIKNRELGWGVTLEQENVYVEKSLSDRLIDYIKIEVDDEEIDDEDCPIETLLADESLYRQELGHFNKFDVGFFGSPEKEMLEQVLSYLIEKEPNILIDNCHGVIARASSIIGDPSCRSWELAKHHKNNLCNTRKDNS